MSPAALSRLATMARNGRFRRPNLRAAALMAVCALALSACGDEEEGTIPAEPAQALQAQLDQIEASIDAGACDAAQTQALGFAQAVNELPADVDPRVRAQLVEAAGNLEALTGIQCEPAATGATGEELPPPVENTEPDPPAEEPEIELPPADESKDKVKDKGSGPPEDTPGSGEPGGDGGGGSSGGVGND